MIILPDKNIPRTKFLASLPDYQWKVTSVSQPKDVFGNEDHTVYKITARLDDGFVIWKSWFDDRNDADAFMVSVLSGKIRQENQLWKLGSHEWYLDIPSTAKYQIESQTYLSANAGSLMEWLVPSDWPRAIYLPPIATEGTLLFWSGTPSYLTSGTSSTAPSNWAGTCAIDCIGGGGGGGAYSTSITGYTGLATGGGGAGFGRSVDPSIVLPNTSATYQVGAGGGTTTASSNGSTGLGLAGKAGTETFFAAATYAAATVGGYFGGAGQAAANGNLGANGSAGAGVGGGGKGSLTYTGGTSPAVTQDANQYKVGGGGGGAAGYHGNGGDATDPMTNGGVGDGGDGDSGFGGAGGAGGPGTTLAIAGGNGTEYSSSPAYGSGGGGGGAAGTGSTAADGGTYGAGGGGHCRSISAGSSGAGGTAVGRAGKQGLIVITYTPRVDFPNMPFLGL